MNRSGCCRGSENGSKRRLLRTWSEYSLSCGRGNGKTTLIGGIAAAVVAGPLRQNRAECLVVAGSFEQGLLTYHHCLAFLQELGVDMREYRVINSTSAKR